LGSEPSIGTKDKIDKKGDTSDNGQEAQKGAEEKFDGGTRSPAAQLEGADSINGR
jgi:hypothetical protein